MKGSPWWMLVGLIAIVCWVALVIHLATSKPYENTQDPGCASANKDMVQLGFDVRWEPCERQGCCIVKVK